MKLDTIQLDVYVLEDINNSNFNMQKYIDKVL